MNKLLISVILLVTLTGLIYPQRISEPKQSKKISLNTTFFILGTLSDYMGRFYYVTKKDEVDRYYLYEKPLMDYLDQMIQKEFKIKITTFLNPNPNRTTPETYSHDLSMILNSYYGKDELLIDSLFKNPNEIDSFLTGKYYRYGKRINDSIYVIQQANSPNHKICDVLLRRIGCTKIHYKYLNNIPAQYIYYFIPTLELRRYFDSVSKQKVQLVDSYYTSLRETLKFGTDDFKKFIKADKKINPEILELFKQ